MAGNTKFEYGFESVNGVVKKTYYLHEIPMIQQKCDVWNVLPIKYVRQFTGLKDKNGKELYFEDVVTINIPSLLDKKWIVTLDDFGIPCFFLIGSLGECIDFKQYFLEMNSPNNDFEIIGNIYESPELLKNGK